MNGSAISSDSTLITVYLVLTPGVLLLDLACIAEPLRLANSALVAAGAKAAFELHMVGCRTRMQSSLPLTVADVDVLPTTLASRSWIILIGVANQHNVDRNEFDAAREATVDWLKCTVKPALAAQATRILTVCSGAFLAGEAGFLDGRQCTTHHNLAAALQTQFPRACVQENRIFVIDGHVASSAGITAGLDLALAAISEQCGAAIAACVARDMVVYWRRAGGDQQLSPLLDHRNHMHRAVHRVQDAVLAAPQDDWNVERMAGEAHVSSRHLRRLFHENAGIKPLAYVNRIRVALARQLLSTKHCSVERAAEIVGFASARQLRNAWKQENKDLPGRISQT